MKMKAVFKKLFKSSSKDNAIVVVNDHKEQHQDQGTSRNVSNSPAKKVKCGNLCKAVAPCGKPKLSLPVIPKVDTSIRAKRLMKELKELQKHGNSENKNISAELVNENLFEWHVKLYKVDAESPLAQDMIELEVPFILLHLVFPDNFPFSPPFMRVVAPPIEKGYVMQGGAICMELLTPRGWASAYTIESVLMQFAASLVKGQGRICRKTKVHKEFNRKTAEEAFRSLVKTHDKYGWITPDKTEG